MKNSFGQSICLTLFGESHGPAVGAVLEGLAPGISIDNDFIKNRLGLRSAKGELSTSRNEKDEFEFTSGVLNGKTTGTPLTVLIPNQDIRSNDYLKNKDLLRPGHADYASHCKYHGYQDIRGGGHSSGRLTAALVCAAAICEKALLDKDIIIGTHIKKCAGIADKEFSDFFKERNLFIDKKELSSLLTKLNADAFPVLSKTQSDKMQQAILKAKESGDSVGGILETMVIGLEAGIGEPWFNGLESVLAHGIFSIPAVKGVSFGLGFNIADLKGSQANDSPIMHKGEITFASNNNGGINGGISNGMPLLFQTAIKPTSSIAKEQITVNIKRKKEALLVIQGRHDPTIVHRARQVVNSVTALVLCDFLALRYGTDWLAK